MKLTEKQISALARQIFECMQADELGMQGEPVVEDENQWQPNWTIRDREMFAKGHCTRLILENIIEPENIYDIVTATVGLSLITYPIS